MGVLKGGFHCHLIFKSVTFTVYVYSVRAFKTPSVKQFSTGLVHVYKLMSSMSCEVSSEISLFIYFCF